MAFAAIEPTGVKGDKRYWRQYFKQRTLQYDAWEQLCKTCAGLQLHRYDEKLIKGTVNTSWVRNTQTFFKEKMDNAAFQPLKEVETVWMCSALILNGLF